MALLSQFAEAFAIKVEFTRKARSTFAFGNSAQQQYDRRRPLPGLFEHTAGQDRIGALASATAIGWKVTVSTEQPAVAAVTPWARQVCRMEMLLKPRDTRRFVQQLGDRKGYHAWQYTMHTQAS